MSAARPTEYPRNVRLDEVTVHRDYWENQWELRIHLRHINGQKTELNPRMRLSTQELIDIRDTINRAIDAELNTLITCAQEGVIRKHASDGGRWDEYVQLRNSC